MDIIERIKVSFKQGSTLTQLLYWNIGIWLIVRICNAVLTLIGMPYGWMQYIELPASLAVLFSRPWTVVTYMFLHHDFGHLFFNMICLYWFGKLFLERFTQRQLVGVYVIGGLGGALFFAGAYNLFPYFIDKIGTSYLLGASAAIMAIITTIAIAAPNTPVPLILVGSIRLKYLALITILISFFGITGNNAGGELAHLGGACVGAIYALLYRNGHDIAKPINKIIDWFVSISRKPKNKTKYKVKYNTAKTTTNTSENEQKGDIDQILAKIKRSGYGSLTDEERKQLFRN